MEFPPLDDVRWDRLLGAVMQSQPLGPQPDAPRAPQVLAGVFPSSPPRPADGVSTSHELDAYV